MGARKLKGANQVERRPWMKSEGSLNLQNDPNISMKVKVNRRTGEKEKATVRKQFHWFSQRGSLRQSAKILNRLIRFGKTYKPKARVDCVFVPLIHYVARSGTCRRGFCSGRSVDSTALQTKGSALQISGSSRLPPSFTPSGTFPLSTQSSVWAWLLQLYTRDIFIPGSKLGKDTLTSLRWQAVLVARESTPPDR